MIPRTAGCERGKGEEHRAINIHDRIVRDADSDRPQDFACEKNQIGCHSAVMDAIGRRAVRRAEGVGDRSRSATGAEDGDRRVRGRFTDGVVGRRELEAAGAGDRTPVEAGDVILRPAVEGGEAAAQHNFIEAVKRLHHRRGDEAVRARAKVDGRIQRAIRVQARDAAAGDAVAAGEITGQNNFSVILDGDRIHRVVRAARHGGGERRVRRAVVVHPGQEVVDRPVVSGEQAADEDLAATLDGDHAHGTVRAGADDVEARVHRPVGIEPDVISAVGEPVERGEIAADQHLAIGLDRHGIDGAVGPGAGIERCVERSVRVQPRHIVPHGAVERGEPAANDRLAQIGRVAGVGVDGNRIDRIVRADTRIERRISCAVSVEPHDEIAVRVVDVRK